MKRIILLLINLGLACAASAQEAITLLTEAYPPFSYQQQDGTLRGISIDQVRLVMEDIRQPYTIEILPWARAMAQAETQPMHCVFAAARTAERQPRFKWVQPLFVDRNVFVRAAKSNVTAENFDEAKRYLVGTYRAGYSEEVLRREGFPNIDLSADVDTTLRKLAQGHIDLMPLSISVFEKLKASGSPLEKVMLFSEQQLGIACNKATPDSLIASMQKALDGLITSGAQDSIFKHYGVNNGD